MFFKWLWLLKETRASKRWQNFYFWRSYSFNYTYSDFYSGLWCNFYRLKKSTTITDSPTFPPPFSCIQVQDISSVQQFSSGWLLHATVYPQGWDKITVSWICVRASMHGEKVMWRGGDVNIYSEKSKDDRLQCIEGHAQWLWPTQIEELFLQDRTSAAGH